MIKKKFLQNHALPESLHDSRQNTISAAKEMMAWHAFNQRMQVAAYLGGFTKTDILDSMLELDEESMCIDVMSAQYFKAIGLKNMRQLLAQFEYDKR